MAVKNLTFEERKQIERLTRLGLSCGQIAIRLERGKNTIVNEIRRNKGEKGYNAKEAQEKTKQRIQIGREKLKGMNKGQTPAFYITLTNRVKNLEMQIEILSDTIKDLMNVKQN